MTAEDIAEAFNTASPRKYWQARHVTKGGRPFVYFSARTGIIALILDLDEKHFIVDFQKAVASFGDYAGAIARAYTSVTQALQAGGIPVVAPEKAEGAEIRLRYFGKDSAVVTMPIEWQNILSEPIDSDIS